jgi:hypothetical protein
MNAHRTTRGFRMRSLVCASCAGLLCLAAYSPAGQQDGASSNAPSLEETRLVMGKWIETQQILSRERIEWQQGKEILLGRLELVKKEIAELEAEIAEAQGEISATEEKRAALVAEEGELQAAEAQLAGAATSMEAEVQRLYRSLPGSLQGRLKQLHDRIPSDPATTRVVVAERFQNVLGILNEANKSNSEIVVDYEVRELADGKPSEVRVLYVGLAQAYYVSAQGEAGVGRPTPDGWAWEPAPRAAGDILEALEIFQGKHSPAFVPLPVKLP